MSSICLIFYKFDFLEQYLRERFNTTSGFHFETKSSIFGSRLFYLPIHIAYTILNEKLKTLFLSLKNINKIT